MFNFWQVHLTAPDSLAAELGEVTLFVSNPEELCVQFMCPCVPPGQTLSCVLLRWKDSAQITIMGH